MKHKIEVFSAGCPACTEAIELVKTIAGTSDEVHVRNMHEMRLPRVRRHMASGVFRRWSSMASSPDAALAGARMRKPSVRHFARSM